MARRHDAGATLVTLAVGLLIGLAVATVVLDVFATYEARKRNASGIAEAHQTGALALATLATEVANAGLGIASAATALGSCPDTGSIDTTLRPVSVLIAAGASASIPDSLVVRNGVPAAIALPMELAAAAAAGDDFRVRSALGFASGDTIVAVSPDGRCAATTATAVSAPDPDGVVTLARADRSTSFPADALLVNLGPRTLEQRARFDVVDATLRSRDLATAGASANPLASNVVLLKAQYGVDSDGDGFLDRWVGADAAPWRPADVLAAPAATLARIKAVRLGLVVRSDVWDRDVGTEFRWVLFDCGRADPTGCEGRLTGRLPAHWRYRSYETVIPLRNTIWNAAP
jgi:type IV pilus assembly protein PilW